MSVVIEPIKNGGFNQGIYEESATQKEAIGSIRTLRDGRMFAYALAGASALTVGKVTESPIPSANANDETVAASAAVGDMSISVTFGGAVTADFYKGGYLWVNDDTGEGHMYGVRTHAAGTTAVTIYLDEPIRVAVTAGSGTVSLVQNRQNLVVVADGTSILTAPIAGVPVIAVTAGYYFWNQVKGPCPVYTKGTLVIGNPCSVMTVDGAVGPRAETDILPSLGTVMSVNADTEYSLINLSVPGY